MSPHPDPDYETPADVGRRLVEIFVELGRLADRSAGLELESDMLRALLVTALPPGASGKLLLVEDYRDAAGERHDPHLVEVFHEEGQVCVEILPVDRWADLAWPTAGPEVGSNAALIAAANGFHSAPDPDLIDAETA